MDRNVQYGQNKRAIFHGTNLALDDEGFYYLTNVGFYIHGK